MTSKRFKVYFSIYNDKFDCDSDADIFIEAYDKAIDIFERFKSSLTVRIKIIDTQKNIVIMLKETDDKQLIECFRGNLEEINDKDFCCTY